MRFRTNQMTNPPPRTPAGQRALRAKAGGRKMTKNAPYFLLNCDILFWQSDELAHLENKNALKCAFHESAHLESKNALKCAFRESAHLEFLVFYPVAPTKKYLRFLKKRSASIWAERFIVFFQSFLLFVKIDNLSRKNWVTISRSLTILLTSKKSNRALCDRTNWNTGKIFALLTAQKKRKTRIKKKGGERLNLKNAHSCNRD